VSIIYIYVFTIHLVIKHLKIPLVYIERPSLSLLLLLYKISCIDLVEEGHYSPFAVILLKNNYILIS
jgi:hypothetical protein